MLQLWVSLVRWWHIGRSRRLALAVLVLGVGLDSSAKAEPQPSSPVRFELSRDGDSKTAQTSFQGALVLHPAISTGEAVRLVVESQTLVSTRLPPGSSWEVSADIPGFWARRYTVTIGKPETPTVQRITLWPLGKISGTLHGPPNGKAPQSISVATLAVPGYLHRPATPKGLLNCPVDPKGLWTCSLPAAEYDLVLSAPGFTPQYQWNVKVGAGKTLSLGAFDLKPGASVAGWVAVESGRLDPQSCVARVTPLLAPGASAADTSRMERTTIERPVRKDGFFQVTGLAPGAYRLEVRQAGLAPARLSPLQISPGAETFLRDPLLLIQPLRIGLSIVPPLDGLDKPWTVAVYRAGEGGNFRGAPAFDGAADREGHVTIPGQSAGRFWVKVSDSLGNPLYSNRDLQIDGSGEAQREIDIVLVTVKGALTLGREPLAATLWFGGKHGAPSVKMESDAKGRFHGMLPRQGTWQVDVKAPEPPIETRARVEIQADSSGKATAEVSLPDTRITGRVVDEEGRPASGADVFFVTNGAHNIQVPKTADEHGAFQARALPEGPLVVTAEGERQGPYAGWTSEPTQVNLIEGQAAGPLELRLRKTKELGGKIVSPSGPVAGARVVAIPQSPMPDAGGSATTDLAGSFHLQVPQKTESATVIVSAPGRALKAFDAVTEGQDLALEVTEEGGTLELALPDPPVMERKGLSLRIAQDGLWLPVGLLFQWANGHGETSAADTGQVRHIPALAPGDYQVCLVPRELLPGTGAPTAGACDAGALSSGGTLRLKPSAP